MKIEIINAITQQPYPSTVASGRTFFLVEAGQERFANAATLEGCCAAAER